MNQPSEPLLHQAARDENFQDGIGQLSADSYTSGRW
jgi:hypothetical protein